MERFLLVGPNLSAKLSYLDGELIGTETYFGVPSKAYWISNYGDVPTVISISRSVSIYSAPYLGQDYGWFLFWTGDQEREEVEATESVGLHPLQIPDQGMVFYRDLTCEDRLPYLGMEVLDLYE